MKKYIFAIATIVLMAGIANAKSNLEPFSEKTGVVTIRGFQKIGSIRGLYNTAVNIESREFTNVTDSAKQYGITIETIKEDGKQNKQHTSYVDFDEIDFLIKGIDYISKVKSNITKFEDFQADYEINGDLKISTFSSGNKIMAAITSGTTEGVASYFNIEDLPKIKKLLLKAKKSIQAIK